MVSMPSVHIRSMRIDLLLDLTKHVGEKLEFNYFTWPTRYSRILLQYYTCYEHEEWTRGKKMKNNFRYP